MTAQMSVTESEFQETRKSRKGGTNEQMSTAALGVSQTAQITIILQFLKEWL